VVCVLLQREATTVSSKATSMTATTNGGSTDLKVVDDSSTTTASNDIHKVDEPCIDRDPNCREWARAAECRKTASFTYMKANCAQSCNYCNPSYEQWVPLDARTAVSGNDNDEEQTRDSSGNTSNDNIHSPQTTRSWLLLKYDKAPIYHGVRQKTNFSDSSSMHKIEMDIQNGPPMTGVEYHELRVKDVLHSMNSYLNDIYADKLELILSDGQRTTVVRDVENPHHYGHYKNHKDQSNHKRIQNDFNSNTNGLNDNNMNYVNNYNKRRMNQRNQEFIPGSQVLGYSAVDIEKAPLGARLPLPENCVNKHPNCALWASLGYCESNVLQMGSMCSPACHSCQVNIQTERGVAYQESVWRHSPYQRGDLYGILENIYEDKIVVHVDVDAVNMRHQYFPANMGIELRNCGLTNEAQYLQMLGVDVKSIRARKSEEDQKLYEKELGSKGTGTVLSNIVTLDNLFSPEECQGLLDTVSFGIGVDTSKLNSETKVDGFPDKTVVVANGEGDGQRILRSSSRVQLFPSIQDPQGVMRYSNSIERLLIKVNLLTDMDASSRVEAPIVFEKYEFGDEQHVMNHFKSAVLNTEKNLYHWDDVNIAEDDQFVHMNETDFVKPDRMENARIFGLTVFLSGEGEKSDGGEVYFPKMDDLEILPKTGSAILFPTVPDMVGQEAYAGKIRTNTSTALDEQFDHLGKDSTTLVEEVHTMFGHKPVSRGTKYCVTFYFRRYEDENRLHADV